MFIIIITVNIQFMYVCMIYIDICISYIYLYTVYVCMWSEPQDGGSGSGFRPDVIYYQIKIMVCGTHNLRSNVR